jgi:threonine/homoserine/homoserine lactone efflux protein
LDWLAPLVVFSIVSSGSPGPNNVMLWASGAAFGLRRTIAHVLGTAIAIGAMALASAAGLAALIAALPGLAIVMKAAGSAYLAYLAWQIARSGDLQQAAMARPFDLRQAMLFQVVNPKAWTFALGAVTTFRPVELPLAVGAVAVAATMMVVIVPTALAWAVAGGALARLLTGPRTRRVVSMALAVTLAATIVLVWL